MKTISKTATILFLATIIAISLAPAYASASDPSDPPAPAIYFDESIGWGRPVTVTGVGFTPSAPITFTCDNMSLQTVPNPVVADSSGGFTALLMTNVLGQGSCAVTATDGKTSAQQTVMVFGNDHDKNPPGCFDASNALFACCASTNSRSLDTHVTPLVCCAVAASHGLDTPCAP